MEKILVVEDDKVFAKIVSNKLKQIRFSPFVAPSLKDAQILTTEHQFFAALLDLNLPDAPDGEIVDFILGKKIPSVVLTGTYDDDIRIAMNQKSIIDYVLKTREEGIDYAIHLIKRIFYYQNTKALVVEDSASQRLFIRKLLDALLFQTFEAENGVQALEIMKKNPDIKLVLTDFYMPEMDGFELTLQLRKQHKEDSLVIVALTAHDSKDTASKFLKFGASDYLVKPFTKEELNYRINKKMDILEMIQEIKDYSEKLEIANESIRHANSARIKYIQTIEEYLDIIDRHVLLSKTDLEGNITYASSAFLKLLGYTWAELVGKNHRVMRHPDISDSFFKEMWQTISKKDTWTGEFKSQKKNGDSLWFHTTISPIVDDTAKHTGYVAIRNDMTDCILARKRKTDSL
jgi:PAS domain S-box-containing protein